MAGNAGAKKNPGLVPGARLAKGSVVVQRLLALRVRWGGGYLDLAAISTAWAAASLAIGTRNGEQET